LFGKVTRPRNVIGTVVIAARGAAIVARRECAA